MKTEVRKMISIGKVMAGVITVLVTTILVALVLYPTISSIEFTGTNATMYSTLIMVTLTLSFLIPVLVVVKMISNGRD